MAGAEAAREGASLAVGDSKLKRDRLSSATDSGGVGTDVVSGVGISARAGEVCVAIAVVIWDTVDGGGREVCVAIVLRSRGTLIFPPAGA